MLERLVDFVLAFVHKNHLTHIIMNSSSIKLVLFGLFNFHNMGVHNMGDHNRGHNRVFIHYDISYRVFHTTMTNYGFAIFFHIRPGDLGFLGWSNRFWWSSLSFTATA